MFPKNKFREMHQYEPLHNNLAAGRSESAENKGTGTKNSRTSEVPLGATGNGGVPFHAAVKFKFDINHNGAPHSGGDPIAKRYKS